MSQQFWWPTWLKEDNPRQAALNFFTRYWGLGVMQRERALATHPLLPLGEDEDDDEDD